MNLPREENKNYLKPPHRIPFLHYVAREHSAHLSNLVDDFVDFQVSLATKPPVLRSFFYIAGWKRFGFQMVFFTGQ